jgi:hypothetical protein
MNEIRDVLRQAAAKHETAPPPFTVVLHRARRRRQHYVLAGAAVSAVVVIVGAGAEVCLVRGGSHPQPTIGGSMAPIAPTALGICADLRVRVTLPNNTTATFAPAGPADISIKVGETFLLSATSSCGVAYLPEGPSIGYAPGSPPPLPFAGIPGLPSGGSPAPPTSKPSSSSIVAAEFEGRAPGSATIRVELDIPASGGGYVEPITVHITVGK